MADEVTPQPLDPNSIEDVGGFELDSWLDDAKTPQRSMVIYRRADLRSELDDIERKIRIAEAEEEAGSNDAGLNALRAQWDEVAQKIAGSAIRVTVRAITDDAAKQARADAKTEGVKEKAAREWADEGYDDDIAEAAEDEADIEGLDDEEEREALIRRRKVEARRAYIQARYSQAVGEYALVRLLVSPKMTIEQVRSLSEQIGTSARDELMTLPGKAAGEVRPVSAPFSRPSSPGRRGGTSSKRSGQRKGGGSRR